MNEAKAEFFDRHAGAAWADGEYTEAEMDKVEWLFREVGLGPGQRVLEPGCGAGRVSCLLGERVGERGLVLACDISRAMVEKARGRCREMPWVRVERAGVEDLDPGRGAFDLVLCFNVFPHFDRKPRAVVLMAQALKPGGALAVFHLEPSSFINDLHRKAGTVVERDLLPGRDELETMFRDAGLAPQSFTDDDRFLALARKPE